MLGQERIFKTFPGFKKFLNCFHHKQTLMFRVESSLRISANTVRADRMQTSYNILFGYTYIYVVIIMIDSQTADQSFRFVVMLLKVLKKRQNLASMITLRKIMKEILGEMKKQNLNKVQNHIKMTTTENEFQMSQHILNSI